MDYVDKLIKSIKECEVDDFDEVFESFIEGEIERSISDITRLCNILTNRDPSWIEPHQFRKIEKMIIITVTENGCKDDLYSLFIELVPMFENYSEHAKEVLNLLLPELENEDIMNSFLFAYKEVDHNLKKQIKNTYIERKKYSVRVELIDRTLEKLDNIR